VDEKCKGNGRFGDQKGNIKMDVREISSEDGQQMEVAQDRDQWRALVLSMVLKIQLPDTIHVVDIAPLTVLVSNRIYRVLLCSVIDLF
jgi:hypothetical protein